MKSPSRRDFNKSLRQAKTPKEVHEVYSTFADEELYFIGLAALASNDKYVATVVGILRNDPARKMRNQKGHKPDHLTKRSAVQLANLLERYGNRVLNKIDRLENPK